MLQYRNEIPVAAHRGNSRYFPEEIPELYDAALANGARLFTANDPAWSMEYLRKKGLHR